MRKKKIQEWYENLDDLESIMGTEVYRNYQRNQTLINFDFIPDNISNEILEVYKNENGKRAKGVLNYLITKRCRMLVEAASDFQSK